MPMLDAALAFAITMLAIASVVTAIVGKIGASATYRAETLKRQLRKFYRTHVKHVVEEQLDLAAETADEQARDALSRFMSEMKVEGKVELSTRDLLAGLADTELGERLRTQLGDEMDEFVRKLGTHWEQIGHEFSAKFRKRAQGASFAVGITVAIVLNIDSIHIIETYLNDDQVRAEALGKQDAMLTQYAAFLNAQPSGDDAVAQAQADIESIRDDIDVLRSGGFPLGWDHAPWNACPNDDGRFLPRCGAVEQGSVPTAGDGWYVWIWGILLTGYLAGLGAPFWYDFVSGINHIAQARRGSHQRNTGGETPAPS